MIEIIMDVSAKFVDDPEVVQRFNEGKAEMKETPKGNKYLRIEYEDE